VVALGPTVEVDELPLHGLYDFEGDEIGAYPAGDWRVLYGGSSGSVTEGAAERGHVFTIRAAAGSGRADTIDLPGGLERVRVEGRVNFVDPGAVGVATASAFYLKRPGEAQADHGCILGFNRDTGALYAGIGDRRYETLLEGALSGVWYRFVIEADTTGEHVCRFRIDDAPVFELSDGGALPPITRFRADANWGWTLAFDDVAIYY